jgi:hypothetical protein
MSSRWISVCCFLSQVCPRRHAAPCSRRNSDEAFWGPQGPITAMESRLAVGFPGAAARVGCGSSMVGFQVSSEASRTYRGPDR